MPSMIPVLIHDHDLPLTVRADLRAAIAKPARSPDRVAARGRAANALVDLYGLARSEVEALLALDDEVSRRAA